jgi:DNA-binding MarR family transcriptional regulator
MIQSFGRQIATIYQNITIHLDAQLKPYQIGTAQVSFLVTLLQQDGINQEALTATSHVDKSTTTRSIAKLEKTGYITRKKDPNDNRAYKIYLTKKGHRIEPKLYNILKQLNETLSEGLTENEKAAFKKLLEKTEQNILAQNKKAKGATHESSN